MPDNEISHGIQLELESIDARLKAVEDAIGLTQPDPGDKEDGDSSASSSVSKSRSSK